MRCVPIPGGWWVNHPPYEALGCDTEKETAIAQGIGKSRNSQGTATTVQVGAR